MLKSNFQPRRWRRPKLTQARILAWADAYFRRTGAWPKVRCAPVAGTGGRTWKSVDVALRRGGPGLPGRSSLAQLLAEHRGARNRARLPPLTEELILAWADAHFRQTGAWPTSQFGLIQGVPGESWSAVDKALRTGYRALSGGGSLARLLARAGRRRNPLVLPRLHWPQILVWAEAYARRTGAWPTQRSGVVVEAPEETWNGINQALSDGRRGLPGGDSLARAIRLHRNLLLNR